MNVIRTISVVFVFCFSTLLSTATKEDRMRRLLEKEILKHTIHFVRSKLLMCMKENHTSRFKRQASLPLAWVLEYDLDMDLMRHTRQHLVDRLLHCRQIAQKQSTTPSAVSQTVTVSATSATWQPSQPPTTLSAITTRSENRHLQRNQTVMSTTTTETTTIGINLAVTSASQVSKLSVSGKNITCQALTMVENGTSFRCRDLRVDENMRLPNFDLCPSRDDPGHWRHLKSLHEKTLQFLDLTSLCEAMGIAAKIWGRVQDVKVFWGCEAVNKDRLAWVKGKWSGIVQDNGFLHDVECSFNNILKSP